MPDLRRRPGFRQQGTTNVWVWIKAITGAAILLVLVAVADVGAVAERLRDADPLWLEAAALVLIAATLIGAVNLYLLILAPERPSFLHFVPLFWFSWAIGLVLPGQIGDTATLATALRRRGYSWPTAIGRNLLDKAVSLLVLGVCACYGLFRWLDTSLVFAILGAVTGLVVIAWMAFSVLGLLPRGRAHALVQRPIELVCAVFAEMRDALTRFPYRLLLNSLLTIVKFILVASAYGFALTAVGHGGVPLPDLISAVAISSLVAYIPVTANGLGTAEAAGIALFGALGVPQSAVLSAYVALRLLVLVLAWLPVAIWLTTTAVTRP